MLSKRLIYNVNFNFKVLLTKFLLLSHDYNCVIILYFVSRHYKISEYSLFLLRASIPIVTFMKIYLFLKSIFCSLYWQSNIMS